MNKKIYSVELNREDKKRLYEYLRFANIQVYNSSQVYEDLFHISLELSDYQAQKVNSFLDTL